MDRRIVRYLLGDLPEEETEHLDEQSVVDDVFAQRLRIAEDDLVDAYVSGTLAEADRTRFEAFYLSSPRRRQKVAFAEELLRAVDGPAPAVARAEVGGARGGMARARRAWPVAAAAVLVLGCSLLLLQDMQLRRGLREVQRSAAAADERTSAIAGQLDELRAANSAVEQELSRARSAQPPAAVALVLLPQTRGVGPVPFVALHGAGVVSFELQIETARFTRYEAALRDPATARIVWRSPPLAASRSNEPPSVSVAVPANVMEPQHYSLELSGRRGDAAREIIGSYAFQVR